LTGARDQRAKHHRSGTCVVERGVGRGDVEAELLDEPRQSRCLSFRQLEDESRERGRVDDGVLERAFEAAPDEPGVECVVAVLDEHCAMGKTEERSPRVLEFGRADEHGAVDVVSFARIGVDGRAAVDQRVEKRKRAVQREALSPDLEHKKRSVARRLDIERDELCVFKGRAPSNLGRVDGDFLPGDRLSRATRLEVERSRAHRASAKARRAHAISSPLSARSSSTAAA
jgi:hypothetical protein